MLAAGPDARIVEGEVVASASSWTPGGSIVTESTIRTADGTDVLVHQLGGTVDKIGMRVIHGAPPLSRGDYVAIELVEPQSESGRRKSVRKLTTPTLRLPFVRTTNATNAALRWAKSCAFVTYDAAGTTQVPGGDEFDVLDASVSEWEAGAETCSYISFRFNERREGEVGLDGVNLVKFREDTWCRPGSGDPICHDPAAAGLTTLFFINDAESSRNGEILDADVELNGVTFAISVDGVTGGDAGLCLSDLANTATHEFGHLLGLDHTCWDGLGTQPRDEQGNRVPSCFPESNLPTEIRDATMYNFQDCDERKKQTLLQDDIDGICAAYPTADDPSDCSEVVLDRGGCCAVSSELSPPGRRFGSLALLAGLLAAVTVVFRTRPGRRARNT